MNHRLAVSLSRCLAGLALFTGYAHATQNPNIPPSSAPLLDELVIAYPFAATGVVTSTVDGKYCYAAEGCAVALIDTDPPVQGNFDTPIWRLGVGEKAVRPIDMKLDPYWDYTDAQDPNAYLYIAAGRDGLWMMQADLAAGPHPAFRIDDSGNNNVATQGSRRWCNSIEFMTINTGGTETTYLLALFGKKDSSRLRAYKLDDLRSIALAGLETGSEITALQSIALTKNPNANANSLGFGFDIVVDGADAYVAMGYHGIVRVRFQELAAGSLSYLPPSWGPYFGSGSAYDDPTRAPTNFGDLYQDIDYGNVASPGYSHPPIFLDLAIADLDPQNRYLIAAVDSLGWCAFSLNATWDEDIYDTVTGPFGAPDFIHEGEFDHYQNPNDHPFVKLTEDHPNQPSDKFTRTYAAEVQVVTIKDSGGQVQGKTLVVGAKTAPFIKSPGDKNEGRVLSPRLNVGPVDESLYANDQFGYINQSIVYDLTGFTNWTRGTKNYTGTSYAGAKIHVFEDQANGQLSMFSGNALSNEKLVIPPNPTTGASGYNLSKITYSTYPPASIPATHDILTSRERLVRPGRLLLNVAPSLADSGLLMASSNDAGLVPDGPLVLSLQGPQAPRIDAHWFDVNQSGSPGSDANYRYSHGVLIDPHSGFVAMDNGMTPTLHEYLVGFGPCDCAHSIPGDSGFRWRMVKNNPLWSLTPTEIQPQEVWRLFNMAPPTKFNSDPSVHQTGRHYYTPSLVNEEYNQHVRDNYPEFDPLGIVWSSVFGNPQGVIALKASEVQAQLDTATINFQDHHIPAHNSQSMALGGLTTHPEFWNIDDIRTSSPSPDADEFIGTRRGAVTPNAAVYYDEVQTWYSDMFKLPSEVGQPADRWILAVASGYCVLSENNPKVTAHAGWEPHLPFHETPTPSTSPPGYQRMLIRLFDVTDPTKIRFPINDPADNSNEDSKELPGFTIIGPHPDTVAFRVNGVHMPVENGNDRYFLFVIDIGGMFYVYDIGDLLTLPTYLPNTEEAYRHFGPLLQAGSQVNVPPGFTPTDRGPIKTFQTTLSLSDDEPNFIAGMAVDSRMWSVNGGAEKEHIFIYIGVSRLGVEVLRLDLNGPTGQGDPNLVRVGAIQTPGDASGIHIQEYGPNDPYEKLMFVADYDAGFRIFSY